MSSEKQKPFEGLTIAEMLAKKVSPFKEEGEGCRQEWIALRDYLIKMERATHLPALSLSWHFYALDRKKRICLKDKSIINKLFIEHFGKIMKYEKEQSRKYFAIHEQKFRDAYINHAGKLWQSFLDNRITKEDIEDNLKLYQDEVAMRLTRVEKYSKSAITRRDECIPLFEDLMARVELARLGNDYSYRTVTSLIQGIGQDIESKHIELDRIKRDEAKVEMYTKQLMEYQEDSHEKLFQEYMALVSTSLEKYISEIKRILADEFNFPMALVSINGANVTFASMFDHIMTYNHVESNVNASTNVGRYAIRFGGLPSSSRTNPQNIKEVVKNLFWIDTTVRICGKNRYSSKSSLESLRRETTHPFLNCEGTICFGEAQDTKDECVRNLDMFKATELFSSILQVFTEGSNPYRSFGEIENREYISEISKEYTNMFLERDRIIAQGSLDAETDVSF